MVGGVHGGGFVVILVGTDILCVIPCGLWYGSSLRHLSQGLHVGLFCA